MVMTLAMEPEHDLIPHIEVPVTVSRSLCDPTVVVRGWEERFRTAIADALAPSQ